MVGTNEVQRYKIPNDLTRVLNVMLLTKARYHIWKASVCMEQTHSYTSFWIQHPGYLLHRSTGPATLSSPRAEVLVEESLSLPLHRLWVKRAFFLSPSLVSVRTSERRWYLALNRKRTMAIAKHVFSATWDTCEFLLPLSQNWRSSSLKSWKIVKNPSSPCSPRWSDTANIPPCSSHLIVISPLAKSRIEGLIQQQGIHT